MPTVVSVCLFKNVYHADLFGSLLHIARAHRMICGEYIHGVMTLPGLKVQPPLTKTAPPPRGLQIRHWG